MSHTPTVLLVDDSTDTLEMYAVGLSGAGFRLLTAANGKSALAQLRTECPAAIVADLHLRDGHDGWELIDDIKREPSTRHIPIVVLTGWTHQSVDPRAKEAGCAAVLTKPCLPAELARVLNTLVARAPEVI